MSDEDGELTLPRAADKHKQVLAESAKPLKKLIFDTIQNAREFPVTCTMPHPLGEEMVMLLRAWAGASGWTLVYATGTKYQVGYGGDGYNEVTYIVTLDKARSTPQYDLD